MASTLTQWETEARDLDKINQRKRIETLRNQVFDPKVKVITDGQGNTWKKKTLRKYENGRYITEHYLDGGKNGSHITHVTGETTDTRGRRTEQLLVNNFLTKKADGTYDWDVETGAKIFGINITGVGVEQDTYNQKPSTKTLQTSSPTTTPPNTSTTPANAVPTPTTPMTVQAKLKLADDRLEALKGTERYTEFKKRVDEMHAKYDGVKGIWSPQKGQMRDLRVLSAQTPSTWGGENLTGQQTREVLSATRTSIAGAGTQGSSVSVQDQLRARAYAAANGIAYTGGTVEDVKRAQQVRSSALRQRGALSPRTVNREETPADVIDRLFQSGLV